MTREQFKSSWAEIKGPLQKQWERLTNDDLVQIAGDQDTFNRTIELRYGERNSEVAQWANRWYAKWSGWYEGYQEAKTPS
ncbi:CsbD family protein [Candidatus Nitrospira bockiana]